MNTIKTIALSLAFTTAAFAQEQFTVVASIPNDAGGEILFTTSPCDTADSNLVVSNDASGGTSFGCYHVTEQGLVLILWDSGKNSLLKTEQLDLWLE